VLITLTGEKDRRSQLRMFYYMYMTNLLTTCFGRNVL